MKFKQLAFLCILSNISVLALPCYGDAPKVYASPTKEFSVCMTETAPNSDPNTDVFKLHLEKNGIPLIDLPTVGFIAKVMWSPDEHFVAINNRRGNSGDYTWVIDLTTSKVLRKPNDLDTDRFFTQYITPKYPDLVYRPADYGRKFRRYTVASEWSVPDQISIQTVIAYQIEGTKAVIVTEIYSVTDAGLKLVTTHIERQ